MKNLFLGLLIILNFNVLHTQTLYFPPVNSSIWDTLPLSSAEWCDEKINNVLPYLEKTNSKAFIVLKDGKIIVEKYFGTFTRDSNWYWASAGKTLTSFAVGIAQQEGFLSINDPSNKYLGNGWTSLTQTQEDKILIKHQLTMSTGLDEKIPSLDCTLPSCLKYAADPGTKWYYHNGPYTLLDKVIENATSQTLNNYLTAKLKNIIGMKGLFIKTGYNNVYYSDARSMARYGLIILNKGKWGNTTIMSDTNYFNQMINTSQSMNLSYGYLWWLNGKASCMAPSTSLVFPTMILPNSPKDLYSGIGKNGQYVAVIPSKNMVMIRMGNAPDSSLAPFSYMDSIWIKINEKTCPMISTGIKISDRDEIGVSPNPFVDRIKISSNNNSYSIKIYSMENKLIYDGKLRSKEEEIDLSIQPQGMYIFQLYNDADYYNFKVLKY